MAGLRSYRSKRDFAKTAEPAGAARARRSPAHAKGGAFCVQKHAASRLHYDLRLEMDGVLKSWAVPKGPSLDPGVRRLAIQVEDHPLEYGDFEGVIPKKEYGGGTVMLWDAGRWTAVGDAHRGYDDGELKFKLAGRRLAGAWVLVRTRPRAGEEDKRQWLLIKERDEWARPGEPDRWGNDDRSFSTRRTMDEIAAGKPAAAKPGAATPGPAKPRRRQTRGRHTARRRTARGDVRRASSGDGGRESGDAGGRTSRRRRLGARDQVRRLPHPGPPR